MASSQATPWIKLGQLVFPGRIARRGGYQGEILPVLIGAEPIDISNWGGRRFDQTERIVMKLPRLFVQEPHPLGFGRKSDFERWQTRNHIVWGVAEADYPELPTAMAVLWRRRS